MCGYLVERSTVPRNPQIAELLQARECSCHLLDLNWDVASIPDLCPGGFVIGDQARYAPLRSTG